MFNTIFQSVAQQQLEQKRKAEQINKVEQTVDNMKEIFTQPIGDWKAEINARVHQVRPLCHCLPLQRHRQDRASLRRCLRHGCYPL